MEFRDYSASPQQPGGATKTGDAATTVLVIEPDPDVRQLLAIILSESGFAVVEGAGRHALDLCRALHLPVDLVISAEPALPQAPIPVVRLSKPFGIRELLAEVQAACSPGNDVPVSQAAPDQSIAGHRLSARAAQQAFPSRRRRPAAPLRQQSR